MSKRSQVQLRGSEEFLDFLDALASTLIATTGHSADLLDGMKTLIYGLKNLTEHEIDAKIIKWTEPKHPQLFLDAQQAVASVQDDKKRKMYTGLLCHQLTQISKKGYIKAMYVFLNLLEHLKFHPESDVLDKKKKPATKKYQ